MSNNITEQQYLELAEASKKKFDELESTIDQLKYSCLNICTTLKELSNYCEITQSYENFYPVNVIQDKINSLLNKHFTIDENIKINKQLVYKIDDLTEQAISNLLNQ